jgi:hypothetical protein
MRVSLDYDDHNVIKLAYYVAKGIAINRKLPSLIRKTKRGFHVVYSGCDISEREMFVRRYRLADDSKRLWLDMSCPKKPKQVLFYRKEIHVHEFDAFGNYVGRKRVQ